MNGEWQFSHFSSWFGDEVDEALTRLPSYCPMLPAGVQWVVVMLPVAYSSITCGWKLP